MRFRGLVYRAHNPFWSFSPLSGEGAARHGGRFNPVGVAALYTSLSETVALAEYQQGFPHRPQPTTLCAYEVDCEDVVDLTDPDQRKQLDITESALACAWELIAAEGQTPPSWTVVQRLIEQRVAGVIVPSYSNNAPERGRNLVFWDWHNDLPHRVELIDDQHRLPKNQDSWR